MARSRNIKPSLFKNEVLGDPSTDPLLTILFTGLWCLADKAGYLEDRPGRIKVEIFPYRHGVDINGQLDDLVRMGFIRRFTGQNGLPLIHVTKFLEHQHPHVTEKESEFVKFDKTNSCPITVKQPTSNSKPTVRQRKHTRATTSDSLNTDSLKKDLTQEESNIGTRILGEPVLAQVDGVPEPGNIDETWAFLDDELGVGETQPALLGQALFGNLLINEAAATIPVFNEVLPGVSVGLPDTPSGGHTVDGVCQHEHTIVTAQGEVDHDRTCTDCGLTWVEGREPNDGIIAPKRRPVVNKTETNAEVVKPTVEAPEVAHETFQPGPRASAEVVRELLDTSTLHGISHDSLWAYALQKGYVRRAADGSKDWFTFSEHGAGRFLNMMTPTKLRGFKEHLREHFEQPVAQ
ncbi:MAG: hypothetical protein KGN80_00175 [Acidobacteriota bacterium]|nr:hypothetical protein [Acidobacteriota bacterium]